MIIKFNNSKEYNNYRTNNINYIDIRSRFGNGYIIRDKFNIITDEIINKYNLIDDTDRLVNTETLEEYNDYTKYYILDWNNLISLLNENLNFIMLCDNDY